MATETEIWDQIEKYLSDEMGEEERDMFEKTVSSHPEWADRLEAYRLTEHAVVVHEASKLKSQMAKDMADSSKGASRFWIGAAVLIGIGAGTYFWSPSPKNDLGTSAGKATVEMDSKVTETNAKPSEDSSVGYKTGNSKPILKCKSNPKEEQEIQGTKSEEVSEATKPSVAPILPLEMTPKEEVGDTPFVDPCQHVIIHLDFFTTPSCKEQNTGELIVKMKSIQGGVPPYRFSLDKDKEFVPSPLREIKEGHYSLFVKDGNGCIVSVPKSVEVGSIHCQETSKEYTYSPLHDPVWTIPYDGAKKARNIRILNKGGREVFRSEVTGDGNPSDWNGESNMGLPIETGYYLFYIEYTDGSVDKGTISILR